MVLSAFATPAAAASNASFDANDWSSSGTASHGVGNAASGGVELTWNNDGGSFSGAWTYTTTATATGSHEFDWTFQGHHSWYQSDAKAYVFADGPGGITQVLLSDRGGGGFSDSGTASIQVHQGYDFGIRVTGSHFDSSRLMHGTFTLTPTNAAPSAALSAPSSSEEGSTVSLDASGSTDSDGSVVSYAWDLDGDGQFDDGNSPTASTSFSDDGSSVVSVRVTDDGGATDTASATIAVSNVDPTVTASVSPPTIDEGDTATVSASYTDPGTADTHTATIDWGDGNVETAAASGGSLSGSHVYADDGTYTVTITVTDDDGGSSTASAVYASFDADDWSSSGTASHDVSDASDGGIELAWDNDGGGFSGAWTYATTATATGTHEFDWTFQGHHSWYQSDAKAYVFADGPGGITQVLLSDRGGGFSDSGTATIQVHQGYDFGIRVTGSHFDSSRLMHGTFTLTPAAGGSPPTVVVSNVAPDVSATGDSITEGDSATVSASFTDPGTVDTHTAQIDWGDGSPVESVSVSQGAGSGSLSAGHAYADDGTYTVTVTVTDDHGGVGTATTDVIVENVAPVLTADVDDSGVADSPVSASGSFTDVGTDDTHAVEIDWGDGTVESVAVSQAPGSGSFASDHEYSTGGSYDVSVTVTDDDGGVDSYTETIIVSHLATVDVKPDSAANPVNPGSKGVLPVAILATDTFDPAEVDVSSLRLAATDGGSGAKAAHGGHFEDVDDDGDLDLLVHFETEDIGLTDDSTIVSLSGVTTDGIPIVGSDSVTPVGNDKGNANGGNSGNGRGR